MNLLITAATKFEIAPFIEEKKSDFEDVDVLITGVGMVALAYALGKKLSEKRYDALINIGIGGSFDKTLPLGSVVRVQSDAFSEMGAQDGERFLTIDDIGFGKSTFYEHADPFLSLPSVLKLKPVTSITVNTVHGNQDSIARISARLNPDVENMEGASAFYAAQQNEIYSMQIRGISNYVEKRDRSNWQIDLAIQNLNRWLLEFVSEVYHKKL